MSADSARYSLSVFHQLHCIVSILSILWAYLTLTGIKGVLRHEFYFPDHENMSSTHSTEHNRYGHIHSGHVSHCFDYLRQAVMCSGDLTLEHAAIDADGERRRVDGWGAPHVCRDWDAIVEFAVSHRALDRHGIL